MGFKNYEYELLYRGTRDGFKAAKFHELCDNQGPTLCLMKTSKDYICGGFASESWKSLDEGNYEQDSKAFIFSLTKESRHLTIESDHAIYQNKEEMFDFGLYDLYVWDDCNVEIKPENDDNFGFSYQLPAYMVYLSEKANSYLGGAESYTVKEIEVFKVINYK